VAGAVIEATSDVVLAWGVFATVESPEPQPVSVKAIRATAAEPVSGSVRHGNDHTPGTVPSTGPEAWQAGPGVLTVTRSSQLG
jgi:hypothetical protein